MLTDRDPHAYYKIIIFDNLIFQFEACSPTQSKMSYPGGMSSRLRQPTRLSTPVRTGIPMPAGMRTGIPKPSVPLKMK